MAAKARAVQFEVGGAFQIQAQARVMRRLSCHSSHASLQRAACLNAWRDESFLCHLADAADQVRALRRADPSDARRNKRAGWQRHAAQRLKLQRAVSPGAWLRALLREKLNHWAVQIILRFRLESALDTLRRVRRLWLPPCARGAESGCCGAVLEPSEEFLGPFKGPSGEARRTS